MQASHNTSHSYKNPCCLFSQTGKLPFSTQHISASKGNFAECQMTLNLLIGVKETE